MVERPISFKRRMVNGGCPLVIQSPQRLNKKNRLFNCIYASVRKSCRMWLCRRWCLAVNLDTKFNLTGCEAFDFLHADTRLRGMEINDSVGAQSVLQDMRNAPGVLLARGACVSACKIGSDAVLVVRGLSGANDAGLKEVDFPSAVHLAFYKLELGNLPLCLSIRPGRTDRGTHGCPVFGDTIGEGRDQA